METITLVSLWVLAIGCAIGGSIKLSERNYGDAIFAAWVSLTFFSAISLINGWV